MISTRASVMCSRIHLASQTMVRLLPLPWVCQMMPPSRRFTRAWAARTPRGFGGSVAVSGDTLVVGATSDDTTAGTNTGTAHVFTWTDSSWSERQELVAAEFAANDRSGNAVAVSGGTVLVGDSYVGSGAAYFFGFDGTNWPELQRVLPTDQGLVIATSPPGGPAERSGLRGFRIIKNQRRFGPFVSEEVQIDRDYADLILAIDGQPVKSADDLLSAIERRQPGDEAVVTVLREGRQVNVGVVLGAEE